MLGTPTNTTVAAVAQSPLFMRLSRHFETFTPPQAIDPFDVHVPAFLSQLCADEPITVTRIEPHQLVHPGHQTTRFVVVRLALVTHRAARYAQGLTSPTLRELAAILHVPDRRPPPRRAQ